MNARWRIRDHTPRRTTLAHSDQLCVIFNPVAARRRAEGRLRELQEALGPAAVFRPTARAGHGEELAREAALAGFGVVAAAGGDGTVHEVANGLLQAHRPDVTFGVFPLGSANDYAHSLVRAPSPEGGTGIPSVRTVDVGLVKADNGRERFFVNTLGLGFSGSVALESRRIRRLQGLALYGLAFLRALCFRYACPATEIAFDGTTRTVPTLSLTVAIGRREGSFVVAPDAQLDDGLFDYLHAGALSRWQVLRFMPRLASGGKLPENHPVIWQGRCHELRLRSESPLLVHLDGEFFCLPEDGVHALDIRLLPAALRVQTFADLSRCLDSRRAANR